MIYVKILEKGMKPAGKGKGKDDRDKKKHDKEEKPKIEGYSKPLSIATDCAVIVCFLAKFYLS